jgi:uncharacterized protein
MSQCKPTFGVIGWADLTVPNAENVRNFYESVVGWTHAAVDMGGYSDYAMKPGGVADAEPVAGVCHARGVNAGLPPSWLVYFTVPDLDRAVENVQKHGGKIRVPIKIMGGYGRYCVIEDPAGAVAALFEPGKS